MKPLVGLSPSAASCLPLQALRRVLFADTLIARQLCDLSAVFGYNEVPECATAAQGAAGGA